jgi:hypothetical protein
MDRPPRHEHLEHQQRRGQVGDPAGSRASRSSGEPPATAMAVTSSFTAVVASAVSSTSRLSELKCAFVVKRSNDPMAW